MSLESVSLIKSSRLGPEQWGSLLGETRGELSFLSRGFGLEVLSPVCKEEGNFPASCFTTGSLFICSLVWVSCVPFVHLSEFSSCSHLFLLFPSHPAQEPWHLCFCSNMPNFLLLSFCINSHSVWILFPCKCSTCSLTFLGPVGGFLYPKGFPNNPGYPAIIPIPQSLSPLILLSFCSANFLYKCQSGQ